MYSRKIKRYIYNLLDYDRSPYLVIKSKGMIKGTREGKFSTIKGALLGKMFELNNADADSIDWSKRVTFLNNGKIIKDNPLGLHEDFVSFLGTSEKFLDKLKELFKDKAYITSTLLYPADSVKIMQAYNANLSSLEPEVFREVFKNNLFGETNFPITTTSKPLQLTKNPIIVDFDKKLVFSNLEDIRKYGENLASNKSKNNLIINLQRKNEKLSDDINVLERAIKKLEKDTDIEKNKKKKIDEELLQEEKAMTERLIREGKDIEEHLGSLKIENDKYLGLMNDQKEISKNIVFIRNEKESKTEKIKELKQEHSKIFEEIRKLQK